MKYSHTTILDQLSLSCDTGSGIVFFHAEPGNTHYEGLLDRLNRGEPCFDGDAPVAVQQHADEKKQRQQQAQYTQAKARLDKYKLIDGAPEVKQTAQTQLSGGELGDTYEYVAVPAVEPLQEYVVETFTVVLSSQVPTLSSRQVRNPLIMQDEQERAAAQQIVDDTPDAIKQLVDSE